MERAANIVETILTLAAENGFADVGFAESSELGVEMERFNQAMERGDFAELAYLKRNCDKRGNPSQLVPGAKSVIVFLMPYGNQGQMEREYLPLDFAGNDSIPEELRLNSYKVAQYALGADYHTIIRGRLQKILARMGELDNTIQGRAFVDTAPVLERAWAVRAGLGFIGRNNFLISRSCGIRNFIGVIISNFEVPAEIIGKYRKRALENMQRDFCGSCNRCREACPVNALTPYRLDARRCNSYLTIESKDATPLSNLENAGVRGGWIFGCDACMNACPWNGKNIEGEALFNPRIIPLPFSHIRRR